MPEHPNPKIRPNVRRAASSLHSVPVPYADLWVASNFSFLNGASHPEELVHQAAHLGHRAIGITDTNSLAGIVRAHVAAREARIALCVGTRIELEPSSLSVLLYATDLASYGRLCRLLTLGKRRAPKGECQLDVPDLFDHEQGLLCVMIPPSPEEPPGTFEENVLRLRAVFDDDRLSIAVRRSFTARDETWLAWLCELSQRTRVPIVATNDVRCHSRERRMLQDVVTCIRHGCTLSAAGFRLLPHGEHHLKPPRTMTRLFRELPHAVTRTVEIAERASSFSLDEIRYQYPDETCPEDSTPMQHLIDLTWRGATGRYPRGVPTKVRNQIEHEFALIAKLEYAPYFLTVHDLVCFARSRDILCQGRGAAANSAVCYCLGVTAVDPDRIDVLFERFVSEARDEPPDIDIDFEHERREEVLQYIYRKYGRDRAALTAEVITYRGRSAVREVGKALGLSLDCVDRMAKDLDWWSDNPADTPERLREIGLDPDDVTMRHVLRLTDEIRGFPRHLSQHVGGFVITKGPLCELVPIENAAMEDRTVIEWDKDDIDAMGMLKVDCLGLGMLTCVRKSFELIERAGGEHIEFHTVPPEDPVVYDMICEADTVGVFQIESRAQMSMLPRLQPREFYDLVIEVAIVRPGPIQGDMVHPYLRRRNGEEPIRFPNEKVERVLGKTLGVPIFQEQVMTLAMVAGGFTPEKAEELRRAMSSWRRKKTRLVELCVDLKRGMLAEGYSEELADRLLNQLRGFSEYGFPESHAASFALIVYVSCWLKKHHPAAFCAALINSQPMGFYAPAQLVRDARAHGVEVRPVDVNRSLWDCTLEPAGSPAIRLGMRLVKSLREDDAHRISRAVESHGAFESVDALHRASGVRGSALRHLAFADAFTSMDLDRQQALWQVRALQHSPGPLFESIRTPVKKVSLPSVSRFRRVMHDYASTHLSLKSHPLAFFRRWLEQAGARTAADVQDESRTPHGTRVSTAGVVLVRQRPQTAKGIYFMTLEDETGISNLIVRPDVFDRCRRAARHGKVLFAHGHVERQGPVVHVITHRIESLDSGIQGLAAAARNFH